MEAKIGPPLGSLGGPVVRGCVGSCGIGCMKGCRGCCPPIVLPGDVSAELRIGEPEPDVKAPGGGSSAEVGIGRLLGGTGAVGIIGKGGIVGVMP